MHLSPASHLLSHLLSQENSVHTPQFIDNSSRNTLVRKCNDAPKTRLEMGDSWDNENNIHKALRSIYRATLPAGKPAPLYIRTSSGQERLFLHLVTAVPASMSLTCCQD